MDPRDWDTFTSDAEHQAYSLCEQGACGHAAEGHFRRRLVSRSVDVHQLGRSLGKEVAFHTHFNSPKEITGFSREAIQRFFDAGIIVRNQSVLLRGVNDTAENMRLLVKRLGHINVHPYYVYIHDLVQGGEDMRTTVQTAVDIEKHIRGSTAGFNTPTFVVDAPGGGGKRGVHSYETYDRWSGISVYAAPAVKPGKFFMYFDLDRLTKAQAAWKDPQSKQDDRVRFGQSQNHPSGGGRAEGTESAWKNTCFRW